MLDNALIELVISTVIAQEAVAGIPNTPIQQAFQPTQQGVPTAKSAFMFKVGDHRRGYQERSDIWDTDLQKIIHTEIQVMETTFQISALSTQDPNSTVQYTASDILNLFAYILQSAVTVETLMAQGVGILKVGDIDNPYFSDDRARNEASPSFDFTLTHKPIVSSETPVVQSTEFNILTV